MLVPSPRLWVWLCAGTTLACLVAALTTGHGAWWAHCWLTDPSSRPVNPPCPLEPTTSSVASLARSSRQDAAPPRMMTVSTETPSGLGPASSSVRCITCCAPSSNSFSGMA